MLRPRIIPCLLVRNKGLTKTIRFEPGKYVGDPINAVRIFNEKMVDELAVFDIDATVAGREPDLGMLAKLAAECRMPLCYGGGVRTVRQAREIISLGVEKVAISAAAVAEPNLIKNIANEVGSQSVVVVLDVRKKRFGRYEVFTHNGKWGTGRTPTDVAIEMEAMGAGEIVINNIDCDGEMKGYDLDLARNVRAVTSVPLTLLGGAGKLDDIGTLIREFGIIGAAAGSLFVFKGAYKAVLINYPDGTEKHRLMQLAHLAAETRI